MVANRKKLVLVVDDDPEVVNLLEFSLKIEGFEVISALNGTRACSLAQEHRPAVILMDIMMPDVDGITLCKQIKEEGQTRDIPVIFISAKTAPQDVHEGLRAGAVKYICKPFSPQEVVEAVREVLRGIKV